MSQKEILKLSDQEVQRSYFLWSRTYKFHNDEERLKPFLNASILSYPKSGSWLRIARDSLLLSRQKISERLGCSVNNIAGLERSEENGSITLEKLAEMAAAMDCELVYAIRPKRRVLFSQIIWEQLLPSSHKHWWVEACHIPHQKLRRLAAICRDRMNEAKFRRLKGWTQRKN